ncbi:MULTISPECIES: YejG family protein [Sodalis]|uniref:YejG-like protein n=1 Tax=Sodalis ligni TaxID=2697027 RepID=A0A4R1NHP9_9GAMM|nr:YejG family protein [Sodalis ligni]TCL07274.1 YejG-like protein [Sodalis ligni]
MNNLQLSVIHRLPQSYRYLNGFCGLKVEPIDSVGKGENELVGLTLLNHEGGTAWQTMRELAGSLMEIQISCSVLEYEGQPCLFLHRDDECTALCRLKNIGVAIAEPAAAPYII